MPDLYDDREQSLAKHKILGRYLVPFANKILSKWESIDFIDGFSGPWNNSDTEMLSDTSIGVALSKLSNVAEKLGHSSSNRKIRCLFNEKTPEAFARLKAFTERSAIDHPLLKIEIFQGKFADNAEKIRKRADHKFQLLFVDPTGYTGFPPSSLSHFKGRSSEIIVNFMRSFIERFVSGDHEHNRLALVGLVGEARAKVMLQKKLTIQALEAEYLEMLRADLGYAFAGYSPIHNPDKDEIHFNLAYGTNHFEGMEVMRNAEFVALSEHDKIRFEKSRPNQEADLFGGTLEVFGPYLRARKQHLVDASKVIYELVPADPAGVPFSTLAARAQQSLFLKRAELGDVIVQMAAQGLIEKTWLQRNGRKPGPDDLIKKSTK